MVNDAWDLDCSAPPSVSRLMPHVAASLPASPMLINLLKLLNGTCLSSYPALWTFGAEVCTP